MKTLLLIAPARYQHDNESCNYLVGLVTPEELSSLLRLCDCIGRLDPLPDIFGFAVTKMETSNVLTLKPTSELNAAFPISEADRDRLKQNETIVVGAEGHVDRLQATRAGGGFGTHSITASR